MSFAPLYVFSLYQLSVYIFGLDIFLENSNATVSYISFFFVKKQTKKSYFNTFIPGLALAGVSVICQL